MQFKILARLSIALLATAFISGCSRGTVSELKTYRLNDQTGHFSIDYPKGWYIGDKGTMAMGNLHYIHFSPEAQNSDHQQKVGRNCFEVKQVGLVV